jgi:hypothetical protein
MRDRIRAFNERCAERVRLLDHPRLRMLSDMAPLLADADGYMRAELYMTNDMFHMNARHVALALQPALDDVDRTMLLK